MKGIHPKLGRAMAAAFAVSLIGAVGCSNQPGALKNPFSTADRVPPPSTRVLPPGAAAPYYQGDPLPIMQSSTGAPGGGALAATAPATNTPPQATVAASGPKKLAFSNEPIVAIPSDGDALRFELPPPAAPEPTPIAAVQAPPQVPAAFAQSGPQSPVANSFGAPSAPVSSPVVNAAYETPIELAPNGPWRSPQITTASAASQGYTPQPMIAPVVAAPIAGHQPVAAAAPPAMDVRLRAVPSPQPEVPAPRIRFPGYPAPQSPSDASAGVQPAAFYAPAAGGTVQTLQVAAGPPQGYYDPVRGQFVYAGPPVGTVAAATPVMPSGGGDGFRPRSSMR